MDNIVIGLTGSWRSGCTTAARYFVREHGFKEFSLSKLIIDILEGIDERNIKYTFGESVFEKEGLIKDKKGRRATAKELLKKVNKIGKLNNLEVREFLQNIGNAIREKKGNSYLVDIVIRSAKERGWLDENIVIDGIKHVEENEKLSSFFKNYYLININASYEFRKDSEPDISDNEFYEIDLRDSEEKDKDGLRFGQQVSKCVDIADIVVLNNDRSEDGLPDFEKKLKTYLGLIKREPTWVVTPEEMFMTGAYNVSLRSRCLKRRVGTIITKDNYIISSGFNDVPFTKEGIKSCAIKGECYREKTCGLFKQPEWEEKSEPLDKKRANELLESFKKHLDLCRALHAEERAIIQAAKFGGVSLEGATLYTTTFPCKLCAKKIVEVGIDEVIYCEPYPSEDTKNILRQGGVSLKEFEGVKAKAYFKLYMVQGGRNDVRAMS